MPIPSMFLGCLMAAAAVLGMWITFVDLPKTLADASRFGIGSISCDRNSP